MQLFRNNAYSALAAGLSAGATTLTVAAGQGDRFPAVGAPDFCMVTLQDAANNIEVVRVTARAAGADSMTIVRAQEGTTARSWNIGDIVELRLTAFGLNPLAVFAGASTEAALRSVLDVPTRTGGNASGTWSINITGNAATATLAAASTALQTARNINGVGFDGTANITVDPQVDSDEATNATNYLVFVAGSVGGFQRLKEDTGLTYNPSTNTLTVAQVAGNAATVTNGVYTVGDQTIAGIKTWSGQQLWNGTAIHNMGNVVGAYTGIYGLGGRNVRKVTASNAIEFVNQANTAVTHTLADNGDFTATGNVTAFSDERLKTDWADLPGLVERLALVKNGTYTRTDTGERQVGVSAQSLRQVLPEAVLQAPDVEDGFMSVAYGNAALAACVELAREVVELRARLAALEAK